MSSSAMVPSGRSSRVRMLVPTMTAWPAASSMTMWWARPRDRLLAALQVRQLGDDVAHRAAGDEQASLLAQEVGGTLLEGVDGRVVTEHVVAHLGGGHRAPHRLGRLRDGVAAQVDETVGHGRASIGRGPVASPAPWPTSPADSPAPRAAVCPAGERPHGRSRRPPPVPASGPASGTGSASRCCKRGPGGASTSSIPALDPASTFGGIRTALDLLDALAPFAPRRRIISRAVVSPAVAASFSDWTMLPGRGRG